MIMHERYFRAWVFEFVFRSFIRLISMIEVMPTCSSVDLGFERAGLCEDWRLADTLLLYK